MNAEETRKYLLDKFQIAEDAARMPVRLRNYSRHGGLTSLYRELGFKVGAEIGVEQGKFSFEICRDNPGVKLYCIDPWKAYRRYVDHVSQSKLDRFYEEAVERLKGFDCTFVRKFSLDAAKDFAPGSLDFVFIDGNHHFDFVVQDIIAWVPIVREGGLVCGHDYRGEDKNPRLPFHVVQATNAYTDAHKIRPWFVTNADRCPSWFWVKS